MKEKIVKSDFIIACVFWLLIGVTVLLSGERVAFMLFGLCSVIFALFAKRIRPFLLGCGILAAVSAGCFVFLNPTLHNRFVTNTMPYLENMKNSPYAVVWSNGLAAFRHSPILGVGPNNFVPACENLGFAGGFRNELPTIKELTCVRHPHNIYIEWLAETGVLGLLCFMMLIVSWVCSVARNLRESKVYGNKYYVHLGLALALLTFLWPIASTMSFFSNWNAVLFWWGLGLILQEPSSFEAVTPLTQSDTRNTQ